MSRLIDADNLLKNIKKQMGISPNYRITAGWCVVCEPTVDAVPVIRCKDCKHAAPETYYKSWDYKCILFQHAMMADDYCSHGKRKENDNG